MRRSSTHSTFKVSNPYTTAPAYWTTTRYDALGRVIQVELPDLSTVNTKYTGNVSIVRDQAGKWKRLPTRHRAPGQGGAGSTTRTAG